jgi:integrase
MGRKVGTGVLTARVVDAKNLAPGRHGDGGGLYLAVGENGSRSWLFMWVRSGKRRAAGLGSAFDVSLADARIAAGECRAKVRNGEDPSIKPEEPKPVPTFGEMADAYIATHRPGWKSKKHADQWVMTLLGTDPKGEQVEYDYCAGLRKIAVDKVSRNDVLAVLLPIWLTKAETASRIRGRIETVLDAAEAAGHRTGMANPARWKANLKHALPKRSKLTRGHHKAVPYKDMPTFMAQLRTRNGIAASALEFAILTAARSNEVRGMKWSEIDIAARTWTVPAERMKGGREHIVPLCDRALAILERPQIGELVFPGVKGQPLSDMSLSAVMDRMMVDATPHGTARSSFRDWAGDETYFQSEVIEFCLAHDIDDETEAAYRRSTAVEKRREVLTAWNAYCNG